jgi:AcrR family transcriptional regulator
MKPANAARPPNAVRRATADGRPSGGREKLLQVGARLFVERGIAHVSVEQLSRHAGVSRATFYGFFENKNELAAAILIPVFESGSLELEKIGKLKPRAAATRLIDLYLNLWQEHRDALLLTANFGPAAFAYIQPNHDAFNSALEDALDVIGSGGLLRNGSTQLTLDLIAKTAIPLLRVYKNSDDLESLYRESMLALLIKI